MLNWNWVSQFSPYFYSYLFSRSIIVSMWCFTGSLFCVSKKADSFSYSMDAKKVRILVICPYKKMKI